MAAPEGVKTVKVTVNGVELEVPQGELIVETVKRLGLEIPIFCYHPRMKPVGMCRMCLVEVGFKQPDGSARMMPKPQAGCTLGASEGMVVVTDSQALHKDRRGVLEFLLANHPLDCPICDRGGECPLQNNTLHYGPSTSRFIELKRHLPKAFPLSKYVTLDLERCIQCGRCVRFTEEISGEHELAFRFRGASMQPSTFQLLDFESKFSGNVIEICPVGALTSSKYRFRARPWDLETSPSVCTECSNGCNMWFDHRVGRFVRVNARVNDQVNEEWTCDRGKFGHDYYNSERRLTRPLVRKGDALVEASWAEAYEEIAKAFERPGSEIALLTGPRVTNEGMYMGRRLFRDAFGSDNVDARAVGGADYKPHEWVRDSIESLERASAILVFGTDLASDLPIVYLRVRKAAVQRGARVVVVHSGPSEIESFAEVALRCRPGAEADFANALAGGPAGLSPESLAAARAALGDSFTIVCSDRLMETPTGASAAAILKAIPGGSLNIYPTGSNAMGASLLGLQPSGTGLGREGIVEACTDGRVRALWVTECDPTAWPGGEAALEAVEFLVYQSTEETPAMAYASVVLPMAAPAEQDGTWTNCEGRAQLMQRAIPHAGEAKPAWRIYSEMLLRLRPVTPLFNSREVFEEIVKSVPAFARATGGCAEEGTLLGLEAAPAIAVGEG